MTPATATGLIALITIVVLLGFDAFCLLDLNRAKEHELRYCSRLAWAAVIFIVTPLGGVAYLLFGRVR